MSIYSSDHLLFQQSIKDFSAKEILPFVDRWEAEDDFPDEIFRKLGDQGFFGILIPEDDGGIGADYTMAAAWCEEFGRVPAVGFTIGVNMHSLVITPTLARFGTPAAKDKFLNDALAGKAIGAYAFTEPGAGSDLTLIRTTAKKADGGWIMNGSKIFITNGRRASYVLVLAKTDASAGYKGYTTFVVDTKSPGFSCARTLDKYGWRSSDTAELVFQDVFVPDNMVLGEVGMGWIQAMTSLEWERLMLTLVSIGGANEVIAKTINYINDRSAFGRSISQFNYVRTQLAVYISKLRAVQAMAHQCVGMLNRRERCRKEVSMVKLYGCELAIKIADFCLQLHGGYGYTKEFIPERWLRDLRLNTIGGGTTQIMARIAAGEMFSDR